MPEEYTRFLQGLYDAAPGLAGVILSTHCHNDLGLAVANSFAGVLAGARQVECAINGIGERAGNAALEEFVMLLNTRGADLDGLYTGVNTTELSRASRLVSRLTGYAVQPNKAIVGRNAFAHESGIHQDGVLKERTTFEIMDATSVGLDANQIVLGKHSGRHALQQSLEELGYAVDGAALNAAFRRFKEIADKKKQVTALDLEALVGDELQQESGFALESFELTDKSGEQPRASASVTMPDGTSQAGEATGDGAVDAVFHAINAATGLDVKLRDFRVDAVTAGQDALGEVHVMIERDGEAASGRAVATDIIEAAARAYIRALTLATRRLDADGPTSERPTAVP
jgi:2-isopropylmalate synthase